MNIEKELKEAFENVSKDILVLTAGHNHVMDRIEALEIYCFGKISVYDKPTKECSDCSYNDAEFCNPPNNCVDKDMFKPREKPKDSELRIEWITDEFGCRNPINTNPKRVYNLKKEIERLKSENKARGISIVNQVEIIDDLNNQKKYLNIEIDAQQKEIDGLKSEKEPMEDRDLPFMLIVEKALKYLNGWRPGNAGIDNKNIIEILEGKSDPEAALKAHEDPYRDPPITKDDWEVRDENERKEP